MQHATTIGYWVLGDDELLRHTNSSMKPANHAILLVWKLTWHSHTFQAELKYYYFVGWAPQKDRKTRWTLVLVISPFILREFSHFCWLLFRACKDGMTNKCCRGVCCMSVCMYVCMFVRNQELPAWLCRQRHCYKVFIVEKFSQKGNIAVLSCERFLSEISRNWDFTTNRQVSIVRAA